MRANKRKKKRRQSRREQRNMRIMLFLVFCVVVIPAGVVAGLRSYVRKQDPGVILQGISVGRTELSGLTKEEAFDAVQKDIAAFAKETLKLERENGDCVEVTLEELGFAAPGAEEAVDTAARQGRSGKAFKDYSVLRKAKKGRLRYHIPLEYEIDREKAGQVISEKAAGMLLSPVNASVTGGKNVTVIEEQDGEVPDLDVTLGGILSFLNKNWDGKGGTLPLAVKYTKPEITVEALEDVTDLLGSYTTYYGTDASGRSQNVENGARHLNGILLKPGEELSAGTQMGPCTAENGYTEAASYESNMVVQSMGGGICQVSTTLYNALLYAELEIVERYQHSMLVSYVAPSRDAAIADNLLDLVFKNNQKSPIYIEAVLSEGNLTFNIYGKETRNPARTVEYESETVEVKEPEGKKFVATQDYIGYYGVQSAAQPQITAQLWKVVCENGQEVSREIVNYSQYMSVPETIGVGTLSDDPADVEKISQAVLTQDENYIQTVMQEILNKGAGQTLSPEETGDGSQNESGQEPSMETQYQRNSESEGNQQ